MKRNYIYALVIFFIVLASVSCSSGGDPQITIKEPKFVGSGDLALFVLIINDGKGGDALTGASIKELSSARGELHTVVGGAMTEVKEIPLPPGQVTVLKGGDFHIMFFGLPEQLPDNVTVVFDFRRSGRREIPVPIKQTADK